MILYDGCGEYWGRSRIPYCYPEEIQTRLIHALENNHSINSVGMRAYWGEVQTVFGNYNEINFFALAELSKNPTISIEEVWNKWAVNRFGEKAAPTIIKALKRTDDIGNNVYYFKGVWVQEHSCIACLDYMKAQVLHTGKAMLNWYPDDIMENMWISDFMHQPNETIIDMALSDREQAMAWCDQSIEDVNSVKDDLTKAEYDKLSGQFQVFKKFIEVSIPHIEAYLRYKIYLNDRQDLNYKKLQKPLEQLEILASEIDQVYGNDEFLLSGKIIQQFVEDIRTEIQ